jgi:hypothetical protein
MATVSAMSRHSLVIATLLAGVVVLAAVTPVWAHKAPAIVMAQPAASPDAPPAPSVTPLSGSTNGSAQGATWLLLLAAVASLSGLARCPRSASLALALLLGVFAFERGEHSVHHLGNAVKSHECAVAAAAAHTEAAADDGPRMLLPEMAPAGIAADHGCRQVASLHLSAEHGRAPPAPRLLAIFS